MRSPLPVFLILAACSSSPSKPGAGEEGESTDSDPAADSASPVVELGTDPATPAAAGESFAGVVREGEAGEAALTGGITAEGRSGDLVLWNDRVRVVVQGARPGNGIVHTAGNVLDVDLVRTDGSLGRDTIEDVFLAFGLSRLFHADTVRVASAGGADSPAVVEAVGHDVMWDYLEGMFGRTEPVIPDLGLEITTRYTLPPDSWALEIQTELRNGGSEAVDFTVADGVFASAEDLLPWAPGTGLEGPVTGANAAAWFLGRSGEAAVGLARDGGDYHVGALAALASDLGIFFAELPPTALAPGESIVLTRYLTVAPDVATGEAARRERLGETLGTLTGTVQEPDGTGVAGVRVHLVDGDGSVGAVALTDTSGAFSAALPPGEWTAWARADADRDVVQLPPGAGRFGPYAAAPVNQRQLDVLSGDSSATPLTWATGRAPAAGVAVTLEAAATVDIELAPASGVRLTVTDAEGRPLPALADLRWAGAGRPDSGVDPALHDALGIDTGGRQAWGWTADGTLELPAPPGTYSLAVGHSWRHSQARVDEVVVVEGEINELSVALDTVIERDGWLALDPHLHAAPSFDGALPMEDRLVTCAATGVELPVATDHDALGEYRGLATALGLDPRMTVVPGLEVTTLLQGHFNVFPLEPDPLGTVNGGAVRWWDVPETTQELMDKIRAAVGEEPLLQVNHPRSPGMFAFAAYSPADAGPRLPEQWSWDFELVEVLNGGVDGVEDIRDDWFSMLDIGQIKVPTGVSDSHYRYIPCGLGRTDLFLDTVDPAAVSIDQIRTALQQGHVVVASGTTLRASLDGALPGDTVVGGSAELQWTVSAPDWIDPGVLRVYENGFVVHEEDLEPPESGAVWSTGSLTVEATDDAWVVVEVLGSESQGDFWRGASPYALTNAFFLDTAGDGWTPPGRDTTMLRRSL